MELSKDQFTGKWLKLHQKTKIEDKFSFFFQKCLFSMSILDKNLPRISVNIYTDQEQPKLKSYRFLLLFLHSTSDRYFPALIHV